MTNNVPLHQGEDAVGRPSPINSRPETSWRQTLLVPPELVTVRLDLGWHRKEHVGMFAGEAYVSGTRELLAVEVHPSRRYGEMEDWLGEAQRWQHEIVRAVFDVEPFP